MKPRNPSGQTVGMGLRWGKNKGMAICRTKKYEKY